MVFDRAATGSAAPRFGAACLDAVLEASPLGMLISDSEAGCVYSNAAYQNLSGLTTEESSGRNWISAIHPEDREVALSAWRNATSDRTSPWHELRLLRPDGELRRVRLHIEALDAGCDSPARYLHLVDDITAKAEAEDALHAAQDALLEQSQRAQVTLDSIGDAVLTTDRHGNVIYLNHVAETLTGWSHNSAFGRPLAEVFNIIDGETREKAANPAQRAIAEGKAVDLAIGCVLIQRDGTEIGIEDSAAPIHDQHGGVFGAVIVFREASQSRVITERMAYLAQHDFLTGLPNRLLLRERLTQAIGLARRHGKAVGILYLDLDNFKQVNDSLGHEQGDRLLRAVADRLLKSVRATDTVCREGGDEFVILLTELEHPDHADCVAEKIHAAFDSPLLLDDREIPVAASIGISLFPEGGDTADALLRKADSAMYRAKANGNGKHYSADASIGALHRRRPGDATGRVPLRDSIGPASRGPERGSPRLGLRSNR